MVDWYITSDERGFNRHHGEGGHGYDPGIAVKMDRVCEYVIRYSWRKQHPQFENVRQIYICVDWMPRDAGPLGMRAIHHRWRAVYRPQKTEVRLDDLYELFMGIMDIHQSTIYLPDRVAFADRLLRMMAESWKRSWELYHDCNYGYRPEFDSRFRIGWWPVCLWVHGRPEVAFDLLESGELVQRPGGLAMSEIEAIGE